MFCYYEIVFGTARGTAAIGNPARSRVFWRREMRETQTPCEHEGVASPPPPLRARAKSGKRKACTFGNVEVYEHDLRLARETVPTEGPGVGLGDLRSVTLRNIESFDSERETQRLGVRHISADERRRTLIGISRSCSARIPRHPPHHPVPNGSPPKPQPPNATLCLACVLTSESAPRGHARRHRQVRIRGRRGQATAARVCTRVCIRV